MSRTQTTYRKISIHLGLNYIHSRKFFQLQKSWDVSLFLDTFLGGHYLMEGMCLRGGRNIS